MKQHTLLKSFVTLLIILSSVTLLKSQSFTENFDNITSLTGNGWYMQNNSTVAGITDWFQGDSLQFAAFNGIGNSYIAANSNNTTGANDISNWLVTPTLMLRNGDVITFYTRKVAQDTLADRLQLLMSTNGTSVNTGALGNAADSGDFTNLLLDINPTLITGVYPTSWTPYSVTISGLTGPTSGRLALRYFITNGGPAGTNSDYIGIDNFTYTSLCSPITISPPTLTDATVGGLYSQTLSQTGGSGTATFAVSGGALPAGYSLSTAGVLSGITAVTGVFAFDVTVADVNGCQGIQSYTLNITCAAPPVIQASTADPLTICLGQSMNLNATVTPTLQNSFFGFYAPSLWTVYNGDGGNADTTSAPVSISITSGDDDTDGFTTFNRGVISSTIGTFVSFDWSYSTSDLPDMDYPQYFLNGAPHILPGYDLQGGNTQNGTAFVSIPAGQTFSLAMYTADGVFGPATTVFSNFIGSDPSGIINWFTVASGGSSFATTNAGDNYTFVPAAAGTPTYYAEVTDNFGCTNPTRSSVNVVINALPIVTATSTANTLCEGNNITLTGGGASNYTWDNGAVNAVPFMPSAGTITYIVIGTDENDCVSTASTTITVNALPAVSASSTANTICEGTAVTLAGSGASSYVWDNGITDATAFIPSTGTITYNVTGTDINGCSNTAAATVTVNPVYSVDQYPVLCAAGTITVGDSIYTSTGIYTNVLQTVSGCDSTVITHLTVGAPVISSASYTVCAGGSVAIGTHIYTATGNYTDVLTAANGCDSTVTTFLTVSTPLTASQMMNICTGDSAIIGTHIYYSSGIYTDVFTGSTGCDSTVTTYLTVYPLRLLAAATATPATICFGESTNLNAITVAFMQNNFSGFYDPALWTIVDEAAGTVNTADAPASVSITSGDDETDGYTYFSKGIISNNTYTTITFDWTYFTPDGAANDYPLYFVNGVSALLPGYSLSGNNNQSGTATITVPAGETFSLAMYTVDGVFGGGTTTFTNFAGTDASGIINWYRVAAGGQSIGTSSAGTDIAVTPAISGSNDYYAEVTSLFGCVGTSRMLVTINVNPQPFVMASASSNVICQGDSVMVTSMSFDSIFWSSGVTEGLNFAPATGTHTYVVTATDINGCSNTDSTAITVNPTYNAVQYPVLCAGDSIVVGPHVYSVTGLYSDVFLSATGCDSTVITMVTTLAPIANTNYYALCSGDTVSVGTNQYYATGIYTDIFTSANGCDSTVTSNLAVNATSAASQNVSMCDGDEFDVGFNTYYFTGIYTDIFVAANGCDSIVTTNLTVNPIPTVTMAAFNPDTVCSNAAAFVLPAGSPAGGTYGGPGVTDSLFTPSLSIVGTHLISYSYTALGCIGSVAQSLTVVACSGVEENAFANIVSIFPNPATDAVIIEISNATFKQLYISIADVEGREVYSLIDKNTSVDYRKQLNLDGFAKGVYFIKLNNGTDIKIQKLIVE